MSVNSLHTSYDLSRYQHDTAIDLLHVEVFFLQTIKKQHQKIATPTSPA